MHVGSFGGQSASVWHAFRHSALSHFGRAGPQSESLSHSMQVLGRTNEPQCCLTPPPRQSAQLEHPHSLPRKPAWCTHRLPDTKPVQSTSVRQGSHVPLGEQNGRGWAQSALDAHSVQYLKRGLQTV